MADNFPAIPYSCTLKPTLHIDFVGNNCEKVTGFVPEKFVGNTEFWLSRVHPGDRKKMLDTLHNSSKKGVTKHKFRLHCADGHYKNFVNTFRFTAADSDKPDYILGLWQVENENPAQ
jgi:hypothetical protein